MDEYRAKKERYKERLEAILHYTQNSSVCRSRLLLAYFGQTQPHDCGQCDVCLKKGVRNTAVILDDHRNEILEKLKTGPMPVQALISLYDSDTEQIKELLRWMVKQGELDYSTNGLVQIAK
jgi:ATP-dependent DNA helicase RecQ